MIRTMVLGVVLSGTFAVSAVQCVRDYKVGGHDVHLQDGENLVNVAKIFPDGFRSGEEGSRWVDVEATIASDKTCFRRIFYKNDWFGELYVNGALVAKDLLGPVGKWGEALAQFKKGDNRVCLRTRAGSSSWECALALDDSDIKPLVADFAKKGRALRPALHSSGFGPTICSLTAQALADVKAMGFKAARTHDWAIINPNQRVCDYFHIFPLMNQDAKDPKNYVFGPTDYLLKRTREEAGLDVFFRLGTSIEHSGEKVHFNALIPEDFDKVAETFAATVRHYNRGWANGFDWNIKYWEIWNEPEGAQTMWCARRLPDGSVDKSVNCRQQFVTFYVTVLKRLKEEFGDSIKVGGPALCTYNEQWFKEILAACRDAGVAPDFISWHGYTSDPNQFASEAEEARALCDSYGFPKCELIVNEWHYFGSNYTWTDMQRCSDPKVKARIWEGPDSHNGIRSACFTLATLASMQNSKLDQAYYYGCRHTGSWGFKDELQKKYKVFYALKLFGDIMRDYTTLNDLATEGSLHAMAVSRPDGRKGLLLVDYGGASRELMLAAAGVSPTAKAKALVLDYSHDLEPIDVTYRAGTLQVLKPDFHSAAFFVTFEE